MVQRRELWTQALTWLGRVARIGENIKLVGFDLALRNLPMTQPEHLPKEPVMYRVAAQLFDSMKILILCSVMTLLISSFKHGEVFGHDGDKPLMAKNEGEAIVFPNRNVAVGQRAALMVCPVKTRYEQGQVVYD